MMTLAPGAAAEQLTTTERLEAFEQARDAGLDLGRRPADVCWRIAAAMFANALALVTLETPEWCMPVPENAAWAKRLALQVLYCHDRADAS